MRLPTRSAPEASLRSDSFSDAATPLARRMRASFERDSERLRVLLVAGQDLIHWAFKALLVREPWVERLVGARASADARPLARRYRPHVAVLDVGSRGESLADMCEQIRDESSATRVLVMSSDRLSARSVKAAGAVGLVPRSWHGRDIAAATRGVGLGLAVFARETDGAQPLSKRERQVLEMISGGATNREIAARLALSSHTVKDHTGALYRKLNARNRAEAIVRAQRMGLID